MNHAEISAGPEHPLANAFRTVHIGIYAEMFMVKMTNRILGLCGKTNAYSEIENKEDVNALLTILYGDAMIGRNIELFTMLFDAIKECFMDILMGFYIEDAPDGYPIMQEKMVDNMVDDYIINILLAGKS